MRADGRDRLPRERLVAAFGFVELRRKCSARSSASPSRSRSGGNAIGKHREPIHEVLAQLAVGHRLARIAVGGGDDAHPRAQLFLAADAGEAAGLQHAQQAHLHFRRHLGDLVQEQRAAFSALEAAAVHARGAGERTLFVAEELGLDQVAGNGAAIDRDERRPRHARCGRGSCARRLPFRCPIRLR